MRKVRVGIIGGGKMGLRHAKRIAKLDGPYEVVAIAEPNPGSTLLLTGIPISPSSEHLIDTHAPDCVFVCVPPGARNGVELLLIGRSIPFYLEKPISIGLAYADQVLAALEAQPVLVSVGYQWRYSDAVDLARQYLTKNPSDVELVIGKWVGAVPLADWWLDESMSGGQVVEQLTHLLDLARYLCGEVQVRAASTAGPFSEAAPPHAALSRFQSGALGVFVCGTSSVLKDEPSLEIVGRRSAALVTAQKVTIRDSGGLTESARSVDTWMSAEDTFLRSVLSGNDLGIRSTYADARETQKFAVSILSKCMDGR